MLSILYVSSTLLKTRQEDKKTRRQDKKTNQIKEMANANPFERALLDKMNTIPNENNTIQMKYTLVKEVWSMFLTDEGKAYLTRSDNLRNVAKCKVLESMGQQTAENEVQLQAVSRALLTVIANINLGKNL